MSDDQDTLACYDVLKTRIDRIVPDGDGWCVFIIGGGYFHTHLAFFHEVSVQLFDAVWHGGGQSIPEGIISAESLNDLRYVRFPKHSDEEEEKQ